jgi:hypothetical protein
MRSVPRGDVLVQQKIEVGLKKVHDWESGKRSEASMSAIARIRLYARDGTTCPPVHKRGAVFEKGTRSGVIWSLPWR